MRTSKPTIECIIPVLHVEDLERSVRFYTGARGFEIDWGADESDTICSVSAGRLTHHALMGQHYRKMICGQSAINPSVVSRVDRAR